MDEPAGPPSVCAIVLAYNRRASVDEVLARLAVLPVIEEVIVVDNGDDGTADVLEAAGRERVRVLRSPGNVGIAGRNIGAASTTCEFLLFLDDDAYPLPGAVESLLDGFTAEPKAGVIGGLVRDV